MVLGLILALTVATISSEYCYGPCLDLSLALSGFFILYAMRDSKEGHLEAKGQTDVTTTFPIVPPTSTFFA